MADSEDRFTVKVHRGIAEIGAAAWDHCAGAANPFTSYAFLEALEASGSAVADSGWLPQHLALEDQGKIVGVVPLYLKNHSYGEYVFDHGWANAYERAGGSYYPKLISAVPFTPATGRRLLLAPEAGELAEEGLIAGMMELAKRHKVSSLHVTFPTGAEWEKLGASGFLQRVGQQFHWENDGYGSFDDFLEALNSRKRKQIKRERREAVEGLEIDMLTGNAIEPKHWDAFFRFYMSTSDRKWGSAYLTREFFDLIGSRIPDKILLVMARKGNRYVAGALNLIGSDTLFGRNWGCISDFPFLHFEVCYYRAIDFAIERGLKRVEAGAQGQHKIQRGYLPSATYSAHWIRDQNFADAIENFLERERQATVNDMVELEEELSPFKRGPETE